MGLDLYINSDLPEQSIPTRYHQYLDSGIKGWWLVPYVRTFGHFKDGIGCIGVSDYLQGVIPSWETVEEYLKGEYPNNYSKIWTKQDHDNFIDALQYFADNNCDSYLRYNY